MALSTGPNATLNPSASELVGKAEAVVTPNAVSAMSDAFRSGYITANDIMERTSARAQEKEKADVLTSKLQARQAEDALGNQALAMAAQKAKLEGEVVKGMLGPNGETIEAAYRSVGRLIPLVESTTTKGVKVPDLQKIDRELPLINNYLAEQQRMQAEQAAWEPSTIVEKGAGGAEKTYKGYVNKFTGRASGTIPMPTRVPFDQWLSGQTQPGQVTPLDVQPVAPPAPAPQGAPAVQPSGVGSSSFGTPQAQTGPSGFRLTETAPADVTPIVNSVASRYGQNKVVNDALIAGTAYVATKDVLDKIQPDGTYAPGTTPLPKQDDFKLMVGYAKILDPNSVVREGEIKLLQGTASAWQNIANATQDATLRDYANSLLGKQVFTQQERRNFADLLTASYKNRLDAARPIRDNDVTYLRGLGVPEEAIKSALPWPEEVAAPARRTSPVTGGATQAPTVAKSITLSSGKIVDFDQYGRQIGIRTQAAPSKAGMVVPR